MDAVAKYQFNHKTWSKMLIFKQLVLFLFTANIVSAGVLKTRANDIITDAKIVANDLCKCASVVASWDGTPAATQQVKACLDQLQSDLKVAIADAQNSPVLTEEQCKALINYIINNVRPCLLKIIDAIKNQRPKFTSAGLKPQILQYLKDIKKLFDAWLAAILPKLPASCKKAFQTEINNIDTVLQDAIDYYT